MIIFIIVCRIPWVQKISENKTEEMELYHSRKLNSFECFFFFFFLK